LLTGRSEAIHRGAFPEKSMEPPVIVVRDPGSKRVGSQG
jgi:hypothetical protein